MPSSSPEKHSKTARALPSVRCLVALFLVAGLSIALRLNLIDIPLNRDEGSFAYVGNLLAHGGTLYRDSSCGCGIG
jgi:hypothetical protein